MSQCLQKKTFNDPKIRRSTAVLYKKSTEVTVPVLKKYRGTFVHGTGHLCVYANKIGELQNAFEKRFRKFRKL